MAHRMVMGAIAEFERELMLERQVEGIATAKAAGKYVGRQPTASRKAAQVVALAGEGLTRHAIASRLSISIPSVYASRSGDDAGISSAGWSACA